MRRVTGVGCVSACGVPWVGAGVAVAGGSSVAGAAVGEPGAGSGVDGSAVALGAAIHVQVTGENTLHMVEAVFKGAGRALKPALAREGNRMPSTKGSL